MVVKRYVPDGLYGCPPDCGLAVTTASTANLRLSSLDARVPMRHPEGCV
jgi:hypothetical protein